MLRPSLFIALAALTFGCKETSVRRDVLENATAPLVASNAAAQWKALPEETRAKITASTVPVLWPAETLEHTVLVSESAYYSVSGYRESVLPSGEKSRATITVQGTRIMHNPEPVSNLAAVYNAKVRGHDAFYTRNEEIATVTWIENGVSYAVDVECSNIEDAHCMGGTFVRRFGDQLTDLSGYAGQK